MIDVQLVSGFFSFFWTSLPSYQQRRFQEPHRENLRRLLSSSHGEKLGVADLWEDHWLNVIPDVVKQAIVMLV